MYERQDEAACGPGDRADRAPDLVRDPAPSRRKRLVLSRCSAFHSCWVLCLRCSISLRAMPSTPVSTVSPGYPILSSCLPKMWFRRSARPAKFARRGYVKKRVKRSQSGGGLWKRTESESDPNSQQCYAVAQKMTIDELRVHLTHLISGYVTDQATKTRLLGLVARSYVPAKGILIELDPFFFGAISQADAK
jgi:hypothetical protein